MALSTTSYTNRTQNLNAAGDIPWKWRWGVGGTSTYVHKRIAVQNDGNNATLYPNSDTLSQQATGSTVDTTGGSSGAFFTMHFQHRSSTGEVKAKVTQGSKDWTASGTQSGGAVILNETLGAGNNYWWGIASDNDDSSYFTKSDGARYTNNTSEFF